MKEKKVEPVSKSPQSGDLVYADEVIYRGGPFKRLPRYKNAINQLIELRDEAKKKGSFLTFNVYYVTGAQLMAKFARHAVAKGGPKSINYIYAHGAGRMNANEVDPDTLAAVKKAFSVLKKKDTRKFGMIGCFPGPYNNAIPEINQLITWEYPDKGGREEGEIKEGVSMVRFFHDVNKIYEAAMASLKEKKKIEINLYFGEEGNRKELLEDYPELKRTNFRFEYWKKK